MKSQYVVSGQIHIKFWQNQILGGYISIIRTRAEPIMNPIRQRTGFSNSRGLSASVPFSLCPLPPLSFFSVVLIFHAAKTSKSARKPTETHATQAKHELTSFFITAVLLSWVVLRFFHLTF